MIFSQQPKLEPHPALLYRREKESLYLSPHFSFQAALCGQWPFVCLGDTSSLSLISAVMLDVARTACTKTFCVRNQRLWSVKKT